MFSFNVWHGDSFEASYDSFTGSYSSFSALSRLLWTSGSESFLEFLSIYTVLVLVVLDSVYHGFASLVRHGSSKR